MQDTQEYQLKISLCKRSIYIYKDVIRLLGYPAYVTILESVGHQTLAILPCDESHAMAFKVPDNYSVIKRDMRIWSKGYVMVNIATIPKDSLAYIISFLRYLYSISFFIYYFIFSII